MDCGLHGNGSGLTVDGGGEGNMGLLRIYSTREGGRAGSPRGKGGGRPGPIFVPSADPPLFHSCSDTLASKPAGPLGVVLRRPEGGVGVEVGEN